MHGRWPVGVMRGVAGPRPLLEIPYRETGHYFCIIIFGSSRYSSKLIFQILRRQKAKRGVNYEYDYSVRRTGSLLVYIKE